MKVAFRADASLAIGGGHVARCLTLARRLATDGHDVIFVSRDVPGNMNGTVYAAGLRVIALPAATESDDDADATVSALLGYGADWVIVDGYGFDSKWERTVATGCRIMVIDDLADRPHTCNILLDQNLFLAGEARYAGLVSDDCRLLIGPRYALLDDAFLRERAQSARKRDHLENLLVYFGSGDTADVLLPSIAALTHPEFADVAVNVIANPAMKNYGAVAEAVGRRSGTTLLKPRPNLAELMANADLTLGGSGATTWERMCLGLPSIVVVMADNQRILAAELAEAGLTTNLGDRTVLSVELIRAALRKARFPDALTAQSAALRAICDGAGVQRVSDILQSFV